ncbi:hypothetical protein [Bosea sp. ANAM02]|uniref:hypothetical protein n=1 Tax=Bosea sp. ANAM02 TaxID=2020412 RepID=UPI00140EFECD|nr:hypothetical protein [Bosea sp. ANAM02]BCB18308.1 hypothetical protein OCUBac02_12020 [Bosea sp. ANAM02]
MDQNSVEMAISLLANNLRLYAEAQVKFAELVRIDREEAINNVDRAFEANLEGFHTLYDVSRNQFDYFAHADTTLVIAMRNAIHHRDHPLFRSLFSEIFLHAAPRRWLGAEFLLARYQVSGNPAEHYFRLDDFCQRLDPAVSSRYLDTFLRDERARRRFQLIASELSFDKIRRKADRERYPISQVYLDIVPIFISAVGRVFKGMHAAGMAFRGYDADTYLAHFCDVEVDLQALTFGAMRI